MSALSALLVVTVLLLRYIDCADITVEPVSINTTLNSTVTFNCTAVAGTLNFLIDERQADNADIIDRGFMATTSGTGTITGKLQAIAYEENNNTNISCLAITLTPQFSNDVSSIAVLMIQGLLASVGDLSATVLSGGSSVRLNWTAPYTLDSVPISGYSINGQLVNTNEAILYSINTDPCTLTTAVVTAINGAGDGEPASISFYYQTVPQVNPPVSITPSVSDRQVSLQVNLNFSQLCPGEYPINIAVDILNTDGAIELTTSLQPVVAANGQLMMGNTPIAVPDNLIAFIVNVSLSNEGGVFPTIPSFPFGFLGPVLNIDSSVDNCTIINITWGRPAVDEIVPILHYTLRIYNATSRSLVSTVSSIEGTSYQFEDQELFRHQYTYVIAAVNELGEGETANRTFSYQRAPRSAVQNTVFDILMFAQDTVTLRFNIPIILECAGEASGNIAVTVQCGTTDTFNETYPVAHDTNITNSTVAPKHQQCTLSIVFSNEDGQQSDPVTFTLSTFDVISADVTVDGNSICVVCLLSPHSEGCFVTVTGIDSSFTRNVSLLQQSAVPSSSTVQGCIDELPNGTYTVLIYGVENGMQVFTQVPAIAAVNVTITTPLSNTPSPSESPSPSGRRSLSPVTLIIIIIVAAVIAAAIVAIIVLIAIVLICVLCIRGWRKVKAIEPYNRGLLAPEPMTIDGRPVLRSMSTDGSTAEREPVVADSSSDAAHAVDTSFSSAAPANTGSRSATTGSKPTGLPLYEELQKFSDKRPRAPPQSMERVEYQDIDHIRVKQPAAHSNPAAIQGSVTMVTAQHVAQGEAVPPPVPVKTGRGQLTQQSAATRGGNISPSDIQLATVSSSSIPGHVVQEESHDAAAAAGRDPHLPKDSQLATYL